jgi:hypothetical protein
VMCLKIEYAKIQHTKVSTKKTAPIQNACPYRKLRKGHVLKAVEI